MSGPPSEAAASGAETVTVLTGGGAGWTDATSMKATLLLNDPGALDSVSRPLSGS